MSDPWISHTSLSDAALDALEAELERLAQAGIAPRADELARKVGAPRAEVQALLDARAALSAAKAPPPRLPSRMGRYEILGEVARGGMGVVYRARHEQLGRDVALKVLHAGDTSPTRRERMFLEARAAGTLRHPNIVPIHDVDEARGCPFLVYELIEGEALDARLERDGSLPEREAAELLRQLAGAVHYAHEHLILHRDLKPANVLLDAGGQARLTDFGLAKLQDDQGPTRSGQILGTPAYMAPEQARGGLCDARTDVYGLGGTLYTALTGEAPMEGTLVSILSRLEQGLPPVPPSQLRPGLDRTLEVICLTALQPAPADRYPTAQELAEDLGRWLRDEPIQAQPPGLADRIARWRRRHRLATRIGGATLATVLLILASAGAWAAGATQRARAAAIVGTRAQAATCWSELNERDEEISNDERTALALRALQAAQRWRLLDGSPAAAAAQYQAALALGEIAISSGQWALAHEAFTQADGLGVDDPHARARVQFVGEARRAETAGQVAEVLALLEAARSGELAGLPDGFTDAVFTISRTSEPEVIAVLTGLLQRVATQELGVEREAVSAHHSPELLAALDAKRDTGRALERSEREAIQAAVNGLQGDTRRPTDPQQLGLRRLGQLQREAVGVGELDAARLACEALGRIGVSTGATGPLILYLRAEGDERRAVHAALALCRLDDPLGVREVLDGSYFRFGLNGWFHRRLQPVLGKSELPTPEARGDQPLDLMLLGHAQMARGEAEAARESYSQVIDERPDLPEAWSNLGIALQTLGRFEEAKAAHERALELDPNLAGGWLNLATTLHLEGRLAEGLRALDRALELDPTMVNALVTRGQLRAAGGLYSDALADADRAIELDPDCAEAWNARGTVLRRLGKLLEALEAHERALGLDATIAGSWSGRGNVRFALGDLNGALEDYGQALQVDPRDVPSRGNRAVVRFKQGDLEGCRSDCEQALQQNPDFTPALTYRALVASKTGDLVSALAGMDRVLELVPLDSLAWSRRGSIKRQLGDPAGAREDFSRALEIDPTSVDALTNRGNAWAAEGQAERALADYTGALELDPRRVAALQGKAWCLERLGRLVEALEALDHALDLQPQNGPLYTDRARIREASGDLSGALADLEQLASQLPSSRPRVEPKIAELRRRLAAE